MIKGIGKKPFIQIMRFLILCNKFLILKKNLINPNLIFVFLYSNQINKLGRLERNISKVRALSNI